MNLIQKLKALWAAKKLVSEAQKEIKTMDGVKPGWQTTEFWGKTIVQLVVVYNMITGAKIDPALGTQIVATIEAVYHALRAAIKVAREFAQAVKSKGQTPAA